MNIYIDKMQHVKSARAHSLAHKGMQAEAIFYVPTPMVSLHTHFGIALPSTC